MPRSTWISRTFLLLVLLNLSAPSRAAELGKDNPSNQLPLFDLPASERLGNSFDALLASAVPSRKAALKTATEYWHGHHGLLAEEGIGVTGLYRIGREINGFASRNDWVWELHITHLGVGLDGVIWINAHNKNILALGPEQRKTLTGTLPAEAAAQAQQQEAKREKLWQALWKSLPREIDRIDAYAENTSLTAVCFRAGGVTYLFDLESGEVKQALHAKALPAGTINHITYVEQDTT